MKYFTCLLLLVVPFLQLSAQTEKDLYGSWKFEAITDDGTALTQQQREMATTMFKTFEFALKPGGVYEGTLAGIYETGTWKLNGKTIEMDNGQNAGKVFSIGIVSIESGKMVVDMKKFRVTMLRTALPAQYKMLSRKWIFNGTRRDEDSDLVAAPKNNFLELRDDGTYTLVLGQVNETGTWLYSEKINALGLTANGTGKQWQIVSLSQDALILNMNTSKTEFVFSVAK